jgi:hypothetical protein
MAETNPNGANQWMADPRQKMCWDLYVNPKSETFGNGFKSAIKAGYEEGYANQITTVDWFKEKVRRMNMLGKAEKVLDEMLDMPVVVMKTKDEEICVMTEPSLVKIKQDTAKFIAERVGKEEGYSTRSEVTGKDGKDLTVNVIQYGNNDTSKIPTERVSDTDI